MDWMDGDLCHYIRNHTTRLDSHLIAGIIQSIRHQLTCIDRVCGVYTDLKCTNVLYKLHPKEGLLEVHLGDFDSIRPKNRITNTKAVQFTYMLHVSLKTPRKQHRVVRMMCWWNIFSRCYTSTWKSYRRCWHQRIRYNKILWWTYIYIYIYITYHIRFSWLYPNSGVDIYHYTTQSYDEEYKFIFGNMVGYTDSTECYYCIRLGVVSLSPTIQCPPRRSRVYVLPRNWLIRIYYITGKVSNFVSNGHRMRLGQSLSAEPAISQYNQSALS